MLLELTIGILFAGLTILLIQVLPPTVYHNFYAIALITAALIYVFFSFVSQNTTWILTELLGVILFSIIAFTGIKISPWFLAMG